MSGLPDGWRVQALGEVLELNYGKPLPARVRVPGEFNVYGSNGVVGTHNESLIDGPAIIVGRKGSAGEVAYSSGPCWPIDTTYFCNEFNSLTPKFADHLLRWLPLTEMDRASAIPGLNRNDAYALDVPVPPLETQHRIVAALDAIQERTRAARAALQAVPPLVEKFRQSVLASAFRGDLTADWRAQNPDVEPASELLKRIRVERRERWIADYADKHRARAEKRAAKAGMPWSDKDDAKKRAEGLKKGAEKYEEPAPVDPVAEGLPELPDTWCWARLDELVPAEAPIVYGIIQAGAHVDGGVPYIRPADIRRDNSVRLDELRRTSNEIAEKYERAELAEGDLVFSVVGTIGKWLVIGPELSGANITQSSVRIRPVPPFSAHEILRLLQSPVVDKQIARLAFGNAVQRLNVAHVRELMIPVPPTAEHNEIQVSVGDGLGTLQRLTKSTVQRNLELDQLERSALAKAFRGELVQ